MRSLGGDPDEDMPRVDGVALRRIDADQVIPKPRLHWLAHNADRQRTEPRDEAGVEARLVALDPAQVATSGAAARVRPLLLRHVLELRLAAADLRPQGAHPAERGRAVPGVRDARLRHVAEPRGGRSLQVVLVGV